MIQLSKNAALALILANLLAGCSYDYTQHTDTVAYSAGNAVKANLALQTIDPSKKSMNNTDGLGKNGSTPIVDAMLNPIVSD